MSVHIDRAHHHPRVYKRLGYWQARCPRCGLLSSADDWWFSPRWRPVYVAALKHATEAHS